MPYQIAPFAGHIHGQQCPRGQQASRAPATHTAFSTCGTSRPWATPWTRRRTHRRWPARRRSWPRRRGRRWGPGRRSPAPPCARARPATRPRSARPRSGPRPPTRRSPRSAAAATPGRAPRQRCHIGHAREQQGVSIDHLRCAMVLKSAKALLPWRTKKAKRPFFPFLVPNKHASRTQPWHALLNRASMSCSHQYFCTRMSIEGCKRHLGRLGEGERERVGEEGGQPRHHRIMEPAPEERHTPVSRMHACTSQPDFFHGDQTDGSHLR